MNAGFTETVQQNEQRVLFWDNSFAVFLKLPGELCERVVPSGNTGSSLSKFAETTYIQKMGSPPECAECVHRLDQSVSGLVLVAFNNRILRSLSKAFATASVYKEYWAIVEGVLPATQGWNTMVHAIRFFPLQKRSRVLPWDNQPQKNNWQRAELSWSYLGAGDRYTFIAVVPKTGKTHQIRAQLATEGMHIKGDIKYGSRRSEVGGGIRLHACLLRFSHPFSNEEVIVSSPPFVIDPLWNACIQCVQKQ